MYSELEKRSSQRFEKVSMITMNIKYFIYVAVGTVLVLMSGSEIKSNLLENLAER